MSIHKETCRRLEMLEFRVNQREEQDNQTAAEIRALAQRVHEVEIAETAIGVRVQNALDLLEKHVASSKRFQKWILWVAIYLSLVSTVESPLKAILLSMVKL